MKVALYSITAVAVTGGWIALLIHNTAVTIIATIGLVGAAARVAGRRR